MLPWGTVANLNGGLCISGFINCVVEVQEKHVIDNKCIDYRGYNGNNWLSLKGILLKY